MRRLDRTRAFLRSNAVGLIALFIVLGGTAAALPGKNRIDSGDIKQGQVRTLDIHRGAVTKSKLRRNAVDSTRVKRDSLTGDDIDESTLRVPLPAGTIGEKELADRERRIVIGAGELVPVSDGDPTISLQFGFPAAFYEPTTDDQTGAITEVPLDRAPGSGLQIRLLWDAAAAGDVVWGARFRAASAGTNTESGLQAGNEVAASAPSPNTLVETTVIDISPVAVTNGQPLALSIERNADAPADTLSSFAFLRMVEIRYTATG